VEDRFGLLPTAVSCRSRGPPLLLLNGGWVFPLDRKEKGAAKHLEIMPRSVLKSQEFLGG